MKIWYSTVHNTIMPCKNKAFLMIPLENLNSPCNHDLKFLQKYPRFNEVTWKFELPLLPRAEIFAKISHFCWTDLLNCPYELKFLQKWSSFDDVTQKCDLSLLSRGKLFAQKDSFDDATWTFELTLLSKAEIFTKIKQFCWFDELPLLSRAEIFSKI